MTFLPILLKLIKWGLINWFMISMYIRKIVIRLQHICFLLLARICMWYLRLICCHSHPIFRFSPQGWDTTTHTSMHTWGVKLKLSAFYQVIWFTKNHFRNRFMLMQRNTHCTWKGKSVIRTFVKNFGFKNINIMWYLKV